MQEHFENSAVNTDKSFKRISVVSYAVRNLNKAEEDVRKFIGVNVVIAAR